MKTLTREHTENLLPWLGAALSAVSVCWIILNFHVDVPFMDEWDVNVPLLERMRAGDITVKDFWNAPNGHMQFIPNLAGAGLGVVTSWSHQADVWLSFFLALLTFPLICGLAGVKRRDKRGFLLIFTAAVLWFSIRPFESWLHGYNRNIFFCILFATAGMGRLMAPAAAGPFVWAMALGVMASLSHGWGLAYWAAGLYLVWRIRVDERSVSYRRIIIWCFCGAAITAMNFMMAQQSQMAVMAAGNFSQPLEQSRYILAYLGQPVVGSNPRLAVLAGGLGILLFVSVMLHGRTRNSLKWNESAGAVGLVLFSLGTALLTSIGRTALTYKQALSPRYATGAGLFWIGLCALIILFFCQQPHLSKEESRAGARRKVLAPAFCITVIIAALHTSVAAVPVIQSAQQIILKGREALLSGDSVSFGGLHQEPASIAAKADFLRNHRLSLFRHQ